MAGPNYEPPVCEIQDRWSADTSEEQVAIQKKWWKQFDDDLLEKYIHMAFENNYDIEAAQANILKARALSQVAASKLFPQAAADLNGTKTYFSKNGPVFAIGQAAGNPQDTTSPLTGLPYTIQIPQIQNLYNSLFDASWELDLFGKTRRSVESAFAEYESLIEKRNDTLITVFAEVAKNYIELRSAQKKSTLLQENIRIYEQLLKISEAQFGAGYIHLIDLDSVEADLALARAFLPESAAEIYRGIYALSVLVGKLPEALIEELLVERPLPSLKQQPGVGLRSDLLRRRPDVRFAERKLAEATANVGVAVASFFPTISLLANGGFQSLVLPKLFEWGSKTWAWGADVNMPIFQGGRLVGNLHFSQAEQASAAAIYQQAVLSALQDAETNLKKYLESLAAGKEYTQNVFYVSEILSLSRERFFNGLVSRVKFLEQEKKWVEAKLTQLESDRTVLLALATLYKSLGGGWEEEP